MDKVSKISAWTLLAATIAVTALVFVCPMSITTMHTASASSPCHGMHAAESVAGIAAGCLGMRGSFADSLIGDLSSAGNLVTVLLFAVAAFVISGILRADDTPRAMKLKRQRHRYRERIKAVSAKKLFRYINSVNTEDSVLA